MCLINDAVLQHYESTMAQCISSTQMNPGHRNEYTSWQQSAYHLSLRFLKIAVLSEVQQNLHYSTVKSKALMTPLRYIITSVPTSLLLSVIFAAVLFTTEYFLVKGMKHTLIVDSLTRKQKCVHILNTDLFYVSGMTRAGIWTSA